MPKAIGPAFTALGTLTSRTAPAAGSPGGRPRQTLAHGTLTARNRPGPAAEPPGPLRIATNGTGAIQALRPGPGKLAARATSSGDEGRPPFDFGALDFPMVFPMQPIDPVNPARVPHVPPPADARYPNTVPMLSAYANEQHGMVFGQKVKYLDETERQAFKVSVKDGLLHGADGKPFDTRAATASGETTGRAIFVMDHAGELYLSNQAGLAEFQHTSFLAGQPVAAAGTLRVEDGQVKEITRSSGHYRPAAEFLDQAVAELKARGVAPGFTVVRDV